MSMLTLLLACTTSSPPEPTAQALPAPEPVDAVHPISADGLREEIYGTATRTRLYNVWATWCAPCREEMPRLAAWASDHDEVELVLVNVDSPKARKARVGPFLEKVGLADARNLYLDDPDPSYALSQVVPNFAFSLPLTLVVDRSGEVRHRFDRVLRDHDLETLP